MRALMWWGESDVRVEEVPEPARRAGEVLLRVLAAGICGSDIGRYAGRGSRQPPPIVLGHEFAGEVVGLTTGSPLAVGERVAVHPLLADGTCVQCRAGRENLCRTRSLIGAHRPGAFAEFVSVPADSCVRLPAAMAPEAGALIEPLACALHAMARGRIEASDTLLVVGAGALGLLLVLTASSSGVRGIVVSDPAPGRRETARRLGATNVLDPGGAPIRDQVSEITGGEGFGVVVDAVGTATTRRDAIDLVAPGGRIVLLGLHESDLDGSAASVVLNEISLIGSFAYTKRTFETAVAKAGQGLVDVLAWECDLRPLDEGPAAFRELAAATVTAPRVILTPS